MVWVSHRREVGYHSLASQGGEESLRPDQGLEADQSWQHAGRQGQFPRDEAGPYMASGAELWTQDKSVLLILHPHSSLPLL